MPSPGSVSAQQLRGRASGLRAVAQRMHSLRVLDCFRAAGVDTWVGPSPQRCDDALRGYIGTLRRHADELANEARRLDRIADEIDARARLIGPN